jgi:hypothetical protein
MPSGAILNNYKVNNFLFVFLQILGFTGAGLTSYWLYQSNDTNPNDFENKNNEIEISSPYFISGITLMSVSSLFLFILLYLGHKSKNSSNSFEDFY